MKKCLAIAVLLLASSAAQAQYTFDYGGRTITIDPDRGTVSIPGVYDNTGKKAKKSREEAERERSRKQSPQQAKNDPQAAPEPAAPAAPAPAEQAAIPQSPAPIPAAPPPPAAATAAPSTATAAVAPAETAAPAVAAPAPQVQQSAPAPVQPAPAPVAAPAPAPAPQKQAAAPAASAAIPSTSPLGLWLTEEKEGKVRIEQCGVNLCGYSVDKKSNQNGEQVLINMKPGKDKWSGRILDPNTGSTYDSTIALKGSDSLRVQGCAFGGVFCGGQTWTRVN